MRYPVDTTTINAYAALLGLSAQRTANVLTEVEELAEGTPAPTADEFTLVFLCCALAQTGDTASAIALFRRGLNPSN